MSYEDNILKVKTEFLDHLRKSIESKPDKKIDQKEIMRTTQYFILKKVFEQMECKKEIAKEHWEIFCKIIDFCLSYGFAIIETLGNIDKRYLESKMQMSDKIIDA